MALVASQTAYVEYMGQDRVFTATTVAFDSSYPTGGEALTVAQLGLSTLDAVWAPNNGAHSFQYDAANSKLLAYTNSDGAQVANTTDLSALTAVTVYAIGKRRA